MPMRSIPRAIVAISLLAVSLAFSGPAAAGPVADFEKALRSAYADYRVALAQTNAKNAEASLKAIDGFGTKWSALVATYAKAAPPQYADDPQFEATLTQVTAINARAKTATAEGKIAEAHDVLEAIRDAIGSLRLRNGLIGFSDRMNVFHAHMEHMLEKRYDGLSAAGVGELREDAAVLATMGDDLKKFPAPDSSAPDYAPSLKALLDAVAALQAAARSGDGQASKAALGRIKPIYGRLFVKFG